ncbi:glycosyltransferase family 4 protein [Fervidicoccus fontis]|uniref:Glycosyltransferase family 4 protein n=1 Tax=Fervidicoccus fontis TaxID=683846 RepID=A0A843ABW5_9CREN|nr:glycosyltransferase family 4 protein [Fervidicoccus fontis]MBE9391514.1 glycosyltransferase family 4 protein [Fervidicoccus fontis]
MKSAEIDAFKRDALVAHHFWNTAGGSELLSASVALAFSLIGYMPTLVSVSKIDDLVIKKSFGIDLSSFPRTHAAISINSFGLMMRILLRREINKVIKSTDPEFLFVDSPFYDGNKVRKNGIKVIEYIHFPIEAYFMSLNDRKINLNGDPYIKENYNGIIGSLYFSMFGKISSKFKRENPFDSAHLVLVNSEYVAKIVSSIYSQKPKVLNPPIPPNNIDPSELKDFSSRENSIVLLGRFSREKRYHWVIENIVPKVVNEVGDSKFYFVGYSKGRRSASYVNELVSILNKLNISYSFDIRKNARVYLLENLDKEIVNEVLRRSKVLLHATINEHWGISIAEGMSFGLPVVIHKSGGLWSDLALAGKSGVGYENAEEAIQEIVKLINDEKAWRHYSSMSLRRSDDLRIEKFVQRFNEYIKKM